MQIYADICSRFNVCGSVNQYLGPKKSVKAKLNCPPKVALGVHIYIYIYEPPIRPLSHSVGWVAACGHV